VIRHQLGQAGFPTSGVSATPHFERTRFYATNGGLHDSGNVYKIDRELLTVNGVYEFIISEYATDPSVPEDDEVILVASDYRELPAGIVVEVISVQVSASGHRYKGRQCSGVCRLLHLTTACKQPSIAYARASLRLLVAPEAWRSAHLEMICLRSAKYGAKEGFHKL
jgi:hypothetical protein